MVYKKLQIAILSNLYKTCINCPSKSHDGVTPVPGIEPGSWPRQGHVLTDILDEPKLL